MTIDTLLLVDLETGGLDPKVHPIVEIGCVLWSVELGITIATWADLVVQSSNEASAINRIPVAALKMGRLPEAALLTLAGFVDRADILIAHRAEFDFSFLPPMNKPIVCSKFEIEFEQAKPGDHLVNLAIAYDVPIVQAHRAIADCQTLARVFERVHQKHGAAKVRDMLVRAQRPKAVYQSLQSFDKNELAKSHGFAWHPETKSWRRSIVIEEASAIIASLPFKVREITNGASAPKPKPTVAKAAVPPPPQQEMLLDDDEE